MGAAIRIVLILRAAVERCGLDPQLHLYVRRLTRDGRWEDEEQCRPRNPEELKQRELGERNAFSLSLGGEGVIDLGMHGELIDYHYRQKPFENADMVIDVHEQPRRE